MKDKINERFPAPDVKWPSEEMIIDIMMANQEQGIEGMAKAIHAVFMAKIEGVKDGR